MGGGGRITDSGTEIVQSFQDIGMTPQEAGDQYSEEEDDERQAENESDHAVSFASRERRELYRPHTPINVTPSPRHPTESP
jgi:molybdenum-dependent DNA-binding transcriptional regulator ModE